MLVDGRRLVLLVYYFLEEHYIFKLLKQVVPNQTATAAQIFKFFHQ